MSARSRHWQWAAVEYVSHLYDYLLSLSLSLSLFLFISLPLPTPPLSVCQSLPLCMYKPNHTYTLPGRRAVVQRRCDVGVTYTHWPHSEQWCVRSGLMIRHLLHIGASPPRVRDSTGSPVQHTIRGSVDTEQSKPRVKDERQTERERERERSKGKPHGACKETKRTPPTRLLPHTLY